MDSDSGLHWRRTIRVPAKQALVIVSQCTHSLLLKTVFRFQQYYLLGYEVGIELLLVAQCLEMWFDLQRDNRRWIVSKIVLECLFVDSHSCDVCIGV